jgi:hypothetical protein
MSENDYSLFEPDPYRLKEEWCNQVRLYHEWSDKLAWARTQFERAKANLKLVEADLDAEIRVNPGEYGITRVSEGAIEKVVIRRRERREAFEVMIKAMHKVEVLEGRVKTLDHRKKALECLVQLLLNNYYSEPRVPKTAGNAARGYAEGATEEAVWRKSQIKPR